MTDRTFRSFAVAWNECQNTFKPAHMFIEKAVDFLLTKSDWLTKPSAMKELADIVKERVERKMKAEREEKGELARPKTEAKAKNKKKVTKPVKKTKTKDVKKTKTKDVKTTMVKNREAIDLTDLEPDNSKQEPSSAKHEPEKSDDGESHDDSKAQTPVENGGFTDKYSWTQTLAELDIRIEVPKISAKKFFVNFKSKYLKVGIKGEEPIIDAELHMAIDTEESMWSISEEAGVTGKVMTITLVKKIGQCWWPKVCMGDPVINTRKIIPEDSNRNDFRGDSRAAAERMMFDQRHKAAERPKPKGREQQAMLKKFMSEHPELDFSGCQMPGGGYNIT